MECRALSSSGLMRRMAHTLLSPIPLQGLRWSSSTHVIPRSQIYAIPTYDAAFKWVLSNDDIRPSFFHAFIPGITIKSSERLDEHMNPIEKLQILREFLNKKATSDIVNGLAGSGAYVVTPSIQGKKPTRDDAATAFLMEMVARFDELKTSFPKPRYDGTMDFVCRLDNDDYALVEMQVIPQDYWDRRALAYAAAFYGNQLARGEAWKHIRKVIGVNILGGGRDAKVHWSDTPGHFMRHYKFEDQLNGKGRYIDGIELIQYSVMQAPSVLASQEQQDWITFLREAQYMSEAEVKTQIKTKAVLDAFDRAKFSKLPPSVQVAYEAEDKEYNRYSKHTAEEVSKGKAEGKLEGEFAKAREIALEMLKDKEPDEKIMKYSKLTADELAKLKKSMR
jgi:predicted transposase/invertase (TIGR01784 family)